MTHHVATFALLLSLVMALTPASRSGEAAEPMESDAAPGSDVTAYLVGLVPPGWRVSGSVEHYTPASLYEKINGRSELYMAYAVSAMACVTLVLDKPDTMIEVQLYDMTTALSAFGVFSMERSPEAPEVRLGRQAYREDGSLFFWKGRYYVTLRGSGTQNAPAPDLLAIARQLERRLSDRGEILWGNQLLPKEELVADSVQYFISDALALDFMTDTFTGVYACPGGEVTVFLSRQPSEEDARATRELFADYLKAYGSAVERRMVGSTEYISANMGGGTFDAVFQLSDYVAGVTTVTGRAPALKSAVEFRDRLHTSVPEDP